MVAGGEKVGFIGQHEVDGAFTFIADNVAGSFAECEFGILVVVGCKCGNTTIDGWSDGVFRELIAIDHPSCVEVEECVAALDVSSWANTDAGCAAGDVSGV